MINNNQKFEDLINKDEYQVFVFSCPAYFPFSFARHPWFVVNKKGDISRYEVCNFEDTSKDKNRYLYINLFPPFQGINISFFTKAHYKKVKLLGYLEGDENSTANKALEFIENSENTYPYCDKYHFWGPNSNTYLQNVLNNFPKLGIKLPWNYVGKGFRCELNK